mgnify:CR=1 FL=1
MSWRKLKKLLKKSEPEAFETIKYSIPTFTMKGNFIHFGAYKNHIGFYPTPSAIEAFKEEISIFKSAKGSAQFPFDKAIPYDLTSKIVTFRVNEKQQSIITAINLVSFKKSYFSKKKIMKKIGLLLLVLVSSSSLWAQESNLFSLTLNHNAISVKDVNRSVAFYKNVLHLQEITNRTEKEGIRWMSLGEGKELHLISTIKEPVFINKAVHVAFTTNEFENFINVLKEMKITYSDWVGTLNKISIRADGIKQVYIQDPDGYWIEINSTEKK